MGNDYILGLTAVGVEQALKLASQQARGLVTYDEFVMELWLVRARYTISGMRWVEMEGSALLVKVVAESHEHLRTGLEG